MDYVAVNNYSLKECNTLRLESTVNLMIFPYNSSGVKKVFETYEGEKIILGNGSNILLSKKYYDENYVFLNFKLMDSIELQDGHIVVEAGASLSKLSWFAVESNIVGFEFLEDIPGSVGGAIVMNAGTYEDTIGQLVKEVTYYDISQNKIISENVSKKDFGRRQSKWTNNNFVVLSCVLKANTGDYLESLDKLLTIKKKRYLKQPRNYPNAGSVFKRPSLDGVDYYVWKLLDDLGLRGFRKNDAMISDKHPGFIVNTGNATYEDIIFLIDLSKERVKEEYGINLELEWKII